MYDTCEYYPCALCSEGVPEDNVISIEGFYLCPKCGERIEKMSEATLAMEAEVMEKENA